MQPIKTQAITKPTVQTVGSLIKAHITKHETLPTLITITARGCGNIYEALAALIQGT